ncbi:MAG TPA: pseudouridine synthase [Verrucomicrobiota bacterium]|nr:pseudouridine synthase [Verrucomicrobiota bacterium]
MKVRLQKYLADAGIASRRASEAMIVAGRVSVNGRTVCQMGTQVDGDVDVVRCDDREVRPRRKLHVALNKPAGYVCSRQVERGQARIGDLLPRDWSFLYSVGRLDRDTEGLLLLTNDGDFCLRLTHPRYGVRKKYLATVEGRVTEGVLKRLEAGVIENGELLRAQRARLRSANATRSMVELELVEGKHREVRRLFESQGFPVLSLTRTQIGPINLGELPSGKYRVLTASEIRALRMAADAAARPAQADPEAVPNAMRTGSDEGGRR